MNRQKSIIVTFLAMLMIVVGAIDRVQAMPASPTDETKVPHYFGPIPNWALSQLPMVDTAGVITGGIKKFQDGLPQLCDPGPTATTPLPLCSTVATNLGQYIPVAVPDTKTFTVANGFKDDADYYVIALVQHREKMNTDIPGQYGTGTLNREYVQLSTSVVPGNGVALYNDMPDGKSVAITWPNGDPVLAVDDPHFMGPIISAQKDRPVRIVFYNLLPKDADGELFIPVDTTFMGAGMGPMMTGMPMPMVDGNVMDIFRNPMCGETAKDLNSGKVPAECFAETRASIHLHGGITPWISDGNPHQWITPAGETTMWPEAEAVSQVPDMVTPEAAALGVPNCSAANDGCTTFYYTNQQSARLMFYHDHAWGVTRLNVYAGEAAGYLISDPTELALTTPDPTTGLSVIPGPADTIPLVIQDRTFVPDAAQMAAQDPTWDYSRWGGEGDLWYEHVYMPAQNPYDNSGLSAYGRWFYGPWFWPPSNPVYGEIANPYYQMDPLGPDKVRGRFCSGTTTSCFTDADCGGTPGSCTTDDFTTPLGLTPDRPLCDLNDPTTYQYPVDPFCEPPTIPGTPNNSAGMEQFNDTPIVNGTAYPTVTLEPKAYRFRILNAANDRFFNLSLYVGDPTTITDPAIGPTEVALNPAELAAAQNDPNIFPTPDTTVSPEGPAWVQIGTEGGFLPAPAVINNQPTTWIIDPTRFDVGNVNTHALTLGPAERADVIVDFTPFAGQTLILYNDAPAAFPARISTYDYYTGAPDLSPAGAPYVLPGYGPNTRTVMQIKVSGSGGTAPANYVNSDMLTALNTAFAHNANGTGVFESGQNPIIVGQAAYNSAYGTNFVSKNWCNSPNFPSVTCDGFARISEQGGDIFNFNTLLGSKIGVKIEPKALHDETNATDFEPYGRMSGNIGLEAVPATPNGQNIILYPFVNPPSEIFNATNLPTTDTLTPIAVGDDGTQIWKITHNGVDTHPIHFHLYDVQLLNRVTWDNIIIPPDPNELGWKDTVRVSPLEDTIFAIRPIIPVLPWELPNCIRHLNPMMPEGDTSMFNPIDPSGNAAPIVNQLVNFGWEYMLHCHILSHEEMDMMRPVVVAVPPYMPDGLMSSINADGSVHLTWNDNSIAETAQVVQRMTGTGAWTDLGSIPSPLTVPDSNTTGPQTFDDTTAQQDTTYQYRIVAQNTVGLGGAYPSTTAQSSSVSLPVYVPLRAPTNLTATFQAATGSATWLPPQVLLSWTDNATAETGFAIERSADGVTFNQIAIAPALAGTGTTTFVDTTILPNMTYSYRVRALDGTPSAYSLLVTVTTPNYPAAPSPVAATAARQGNNNARVTLTWADVANNTSYTVQWAVNSTFTSGLVTPAANQQPGANASSYQTPNIARNTDFYFRIRANNANGSSAWVNATPFPIHTP